MVDKLSPDFVIAAAAVAIVGTMVWGLGMTPAHENERRQVNQAFLASEGFNLVAYEANEHGPGRPTVDCYTATKTIDDGHLYEACVMTNHDAISLSSSSDFGIRADQITPR